MSRSYLEKVLGKAKKQLMSKNRAVPESYTYSIVVKTDFSLKKNDNSFFSHALMPVKTTLEELGYPVEIDQANIGQASLSCKVPILGFSFYAIEIPSKQNDLSNNSGTLKIYFNTLPALNGASEKDHLENMEKARETVLSVFEDCFVVEVA